MSDQPTTREEAIELAKAWARGSRSWVNLGPHPPYTPDVTAAMDAQEVVKFAALASCLPATTSESPNGEGA